MIALLMSAGAGAFAQAIDDDTKCEALEAFSEGPFPGDAMTNAAAGYIEETMRALDRLHGRNGRVEIFLRMTEEGRTSLVQTVISRCHRRQAITVADTAIETYQAARAVGPSFGHHRAAQKPARTRYSLTAAPHQP